jgi:hypothetical protein
MNSPASRCWNCGRIVSLFSMSIPNRRSISRTCRRPLAGVAPSVPSQGHTLSRRFDAHDPRRLKHGIRDHVVPRQHPRPRPLSRPSSALSAARSAQYCRRHSAEDRNPEDIMCSHRRPPCPDYDALVPRVSAERPQDVPLDTQQQPGLASAVLPRIAVAGPARSNWRVNAGRKAPSGPSRAPFAAHNGGVQSATDDRRRPMKFGLFYSSSFPSPSTTTSGTPMTSAASSTRCSTRSSSPTS